MNAHSYALSIEFILRRVFNCERSGFGGLIDADAIEKNCYVPIASALGFLYANADEVKKQKIEKFIIDYDFYLQLGIQELLLFTTNEREINGISYSIEFENGEKAISEIIKALETVCK
ncbi:MAG: hypothetical protein ACP5TY_00140 [Thermodesulforhabdaceae bacterium]|jgi:hypothetical protein